MSHLERASLIAGALLAGVAAFFVVFERDARRAARRKNGPPVEKLADDLKHAWSGYHTR